MRGNIETIMSMYPILIERSKLFFEGGLTKTSLRLLPYIQYLSVNDGKLDIKKVSPDELKIIESLYANGHLIEDTKSNSIQFTKLFWDFTCDVLYYSYTKIGRMEI